MSRGTPEAGRAASRSQRRTGDILFIGVAGLVILLDQLSKALIRKYLEPGESWPEGWLIKFTHVTNSGAAFGIFEGQNLFLIAASVIGVGAVLLYYRLPSMRHPVISLALGLVLGGAVGNFIDRIRVGYVTDFIHFPHYPKFNVADSSVTIGVVLLVLFIALSGDRSDAGPVDG